MKKKKIRIVLILFILVLILVSCDENNTGPSNSPPEIQSIEIASDNVLPGTEIQVSATATDEDGDVLSYIWSPDIGYVSNANSQTTTWFIPLSATINSHPRIGLTVSDNIETDYSSETITIIAGITITGRIKFPNTEIPVSGVLVEIDERQGISNSNGDYEIDFVGEGEKTLTATKDDFDIYQENVNISSTNNVFDFDMTSNIWMNDLFGSIQACDGTTLNGVKATLLNPDGSNSEITTYSTNNGYYNLSNIPSGSRIISFTNGICDETILTEEYTVSIENTNLEFDPIIKFRRYVFQDINASDSTLWVGSNWSVEDNHYFIDGGYMVLADFIPVPSEAEYLRIYLRQYAEGSNLPFNEYHRLYGIDANGNNFSQYYVCGNTIQNGQPTEVYCQPNWNVYGSEFKIKLDPTNNKHWYIYYIKICYYW